MRVKLLLLGIVSIFSVLEYSNAGNICYLAKICIHDSKEKCGQDATGKVRKFLDSCDMKEYNCLNNTDFVKTNPKKCWELSPVLESLQGTKLKNDEEKIAVDTHEYKVNNVGDENTPSNENGSLDRTIENKVDSVSEGDIGENGNEEDNIDRENKDNISNEETGVDNTEKLSRIENNNSESEEDIREDRNEEDKVNKESKDNISDGESDVNNADRVNKAEIDGNNYGTSEENVREDGNEKDKLNRASKEIISDGSYDMNNADRLSRIENHDDGTSEGDIRKDANEEDKIDNGSDVGNADRVSKAQIIDETSNEIEAQNKNNNKMNLSVEKEDDSDIEPGTSMKVANLERARKNSKQNRMGKKVKQRKHMVYTY